MKLLIFLLTLLSLHCSTLSYPTTASAPYVGYGSPLYGGLGFGASPYGIPNGYGGVGYSPALTAAYTYAAPAYSSPAYGSEYAYGSPAYSNLVTGGLGYGLSGYGAPVYGGAGYDGPAYGGPAYGGPSYGGPGYGGAGYAKYVAPVPVKPLVPYYDYVAPAGHRGYVRSWRYGPPAHGYGTGYGLFGFSGGYGYGGKVGLNYAEAGYAGKVGLNYAAPPPAYAPPVYSAPAYDGPAYAGPVLAPVKVVAPVLPVPVPVKTLVPYYDYITPTGYKGYTRSWMSGPGFGNGYGLLGFGGGIDYKAKK